MSGEAPALGSAPQSREALDLYLRSDVHAAAVGPHLVLLDMAGDAYHCVVGGADVIADTGRGALAPGPVRDRLAQAGLTAVTPAMRRRPPVVPTSSLVNQTPSTPSAGDVWRAVGALGDVRAAQRALGVGAFAGLVPDRALASGDAVRSAALRFLALSPWLPITGECLVRSALLMTFLNRSGLQADWVFGVRLWPFRAHCWVQHEDLCLNDDWERLIGYEPILVL